MGSRRPLDPFDPISPNIVSTRYTALKVTATLDDLPSMYKHSPHSGTSGSSNEQHDALDEGDLDSSFERQMMRELNQDRVENMRSARPQAFRKARPRRRGGLTMANLERIAPNKEQEPAHFSYGSPGSTSSGDSNRPLNYPREWGTKGKRSSSWLRRITMHPEDQQAKANTEQDVDWLEAASEIPLPSIEDSPLSHRGSTRGTPASSIRKNDSIDRLRESEINEELTGASLIASTPAAITRNTALDDIRRLELETALEHDESVYMTSQPENKQNESDGQDGSSRPSQRVSVTRMNQQSVSNLTQTWTHPAEQDIQLPKRTQRSITPISATSNTAVRGPTSPIARKSSHTVGIVDREVTPQVQKSPKRPTHQREDSQDILKRLARASGTTSSPGRAMNSGNPAPSHSPTAVSGAVSSQGTEVPRRRPTDILRKQSRELAQNIVRHSEEQKATAATLNNKPVVEFSTQAERTPTEHDTAILKDITHELPPKTPVVTGAWVDTPRTTTSRLLISSSRKTSPIKKNYTISLPETQTSEAQPIEPSLPSSALAAVVDEALENLGQDNPDGLGEATIESLQDLMSPMGEHSVIDEEDTLLDNLRLPATKPSTAAQRAREQEILHLRNMTQHLSTTRRGLRDVRYGMQRVENQVAETKESASTSGLPKIGHCDNCDRPLSALWRQTKSFLYTRQNKKRTLTWPSIILLVFLTWLLIETSLCTLYCRPIYAPNMGDFGTGFDVPEMPFVLPTVLFRPFRLFWRPLWLTVSTFVHWLWGFVTFLFAAEEHAVPTARVATETVVPTTETWVEGDWNMASDEIL